MLMFVIILACYFDVNITYEVKLFYAVIKGEEKESRQYELIVSY